MSADKGYFTVVDDSEEQHNAAIELLKAFRSDVKYACLYREQAKYLVIRPFVPYIQWGDSRLEEYRQDPKMVELYFSMENV